MSWHAWTESGYGYPLFNGNNTETVKNYCINHSQEIAEQYKDLVEANDEDAEITLEDICECTGYCNVAQMVAAVISDVNGLKAFTGYDSCGDTNQEAMIGFEPRYGWEEHDTLTREETDAFLTSLAKELGITVVQDYFVAEYCG